MKLITYFNKKTRGNCAQKLLITEEIIDEVLIIFYNEYKDQIILNEEDIIGKSSINEKRELIKEIQLMDLQTFDINNISKMITKRIINYINLLGNRKKLLLCDYADIREEMIQRYNKDNNIQYDWNLSYDFYYDETNNIRKLRVEQNKDDFIKGLNNFFVLGGICGEKEKFTNIDILFNELKLQKNIKELKAKHIYKDTKNFKGYLKSKKLTKILKWIDKNELYFHIIAFDNLNFIVNDILYRFDILDKGKIVVYGDLLYKYIKADESLLYSILKKYNYPAINNSDNVKFLNELIIYIVKMMENNVNLENSLNLLFYKSMKDDLLEGIKKENAVNLLYGANTIISYEIYYQYNPILFYKSYHCYDEESEIKKLLPDNIILYGKELYNYDFVNSKENRIVQLCDVIVSLFAKLFASLDSIELGSNLLKSILENYKDLSNIQNENLLLILKLLDRSINKNKAFIELVSQFANNNKIDYIRKILDIDDAILTVKL